MILKNVSTPCAQDNIPNLKGLYVTGMYNSETDKRPIKEHGFV